MMKLNIKSIKTQETIPSKIINEIQELVNSGLLKEGERLPFESELSAAFGVSRSTIREAIQALALIGLVKIERGKGIYISYKPEKALKMHMKWIFRSDIDLLIQTLEARKFVEFNICRLAAERATEEDINVLRALIIKMQAEKNNKLKIIEVGLEFHNAIYKIARNEVLIIMIKSVSSLFKEMIEKLQLVEDFNNMRKRIFNSHKIIFEAICSKDPVRAEKAARLHMQEFDTLITGFKKVLKQPRYHGD